jgi:hypothetical protein
LPCARLQQGSGTKMAALGNVNLFVRSGSGVDPYFHLPMSDPLVGWRKVWFFLRNDTDAPLPVFTGSRPIPKPKWRYGVAQKDLRRLQPMCEVAQLLLRGGLMGADLLQNFVSHHVQPLRQREMTTWMCLGPGCPNHPFYVELGDMKINTRIRRVLAHGTDQNFGCGPVPLREGVESLWVSLLKLTFVYLCQPLLFNTGAFLRRLLGMDVAPRRGSPYLRMWRDEWRATWSSRVRMSSMQRGCCLILWLRSARTSYVHSELV